MPDKHPKKQATGGKNIINPVMEAAQFKAGESGNPNGRPKKGNTWKDVANELLDAKIINLEMVLTTGAKKIIRLESNKSFRHAVIIAQINAAMKGNVQAARELADRTEGKPMPMTPGQAETIDLTDIADALNNSYEERKPK